MGFMTRVEIAVVKNFSLGCHILFVEIKCLEHESDILLLSRASFKNVCTVSSHSINTILAWHLGTGRTLPFLPYFSSVIMN